MKLSKLNEVVKEHDSEHPILPPLDPEIFVDGSILLPIVSAGVYDIEDNLILTPERRSGKDRRNYFNPTPAENIRS